MRVFLMAVLGFLVGAGLTFACGMALPMVIPISQAEGAYAMGVAFFWTPLGGVLGAIGGVIFSAARRR